MANNTSPLVDKETGKRLTRRFLGNPNPTNVFEKNELKAYLRGHNTFGYKTVDEATGQRYYPYKVRQEYFYA